MKILVLLAFISIGAVAQSPQPLFAPSNYNHWTGTTGQVTLNSSATALTVQQPATGGKAGATLDWASIYCSAACVVTEYIGCAPATATAGAWVGDPGQVAGAPIMTVWTASNVTGCTTKKIDNNQGGTFVISFAGLRFGAYGQYTFSISSTTATANITVSVSEPQ